AGHFRPRVHWECRMNIRLIVAVSFLAFTGIARAADCNGNTIQDALDVSSGTSKDCNGDGIPDECQLTGSDCNLNGIPDSCDVKAGGASADCNTNGVPDECDLKTVLDFPAATTYATENGPFSIPAGDLNGDGHPDLAVAN